MYDRIVIAVDEGDEAERAARWGLELATVHDAAVDVVHVVSRGLLGLARTAREKRRVRERGETVLEDAEAIAAEFGCEVRTRLLEGRPAARISEYAADRDASLVVVGRGRSGVGKRLLGGVTEGVLHLSDVPVLVVPEGDGGAVDVDSILLPTDGSEGAEGATTHAGFLARHYGGTVHALNVVDLQAAAGAFDAGGLEREFVERLEARGADAVARVADRIGDAAPDADRETAVVADRGFGRVGIEITKYADEHDVDLIVMGSHGRSNLKRQLLGSVASTVVRSSAVPVLIVKRPPQESK